MATVYWTGGAGDGVVSTAGNWSGGAVPAAGDTVVFGQTNSDITGTADNSWANMVVTAGFKGTFGVASAFTLVAITTKLTYGGSGTIAKIGCSGTVAAASLEHGPNQTFEAVSGTWTTLTNGLGQLVINAAAVVTTLQNAGGDVQAGYNSTAITTGFLAGSGTIRRTVTTAHVMRGTWISEDNGSTATGFSTALVHSGAIYNKRSTADEGGGTAHSIYPGGTITLVGNKGKVTTNAAIAITVSKWLGANFHYLGVPGQGVTATITAVGGGNVLIP